VNLVSYDSGDRLSCNAPSQGRGRRHDKRPDPSFARSRNLLEAVTELEPGSVVLDGEKIASGLD
jgi:hypothetical protein